MNKKLVALAIAGALSAPMIAQAQTANVTLYGTVRGALVTTTTASFGTTPSNRANAEASHSSRFGIRASEGIGGGLTGFAHLEVGYNADALGAANDALGNRAYVNNGTSGATMLVSGNAGNFQIRESWVGLSGGFGEIKLGSGLNVYDDVMGMNHNSLVADLNNINAVYFGNGFANYNACTGTAFDARYGNSVRYASPNLGPVQFKSHAAILNEAGTGRKCSAWDNAVFAGFGPVQAGLAYAVHNNFAAGLTPVANSTAGARIGDHDAKLVIATVKGSFGMFDGNIGYETAKYTSNHTASSGKYKALVVGAAVNLGPTKVGIDYTNRDNAITATGVGGTIIGSNTLGGGNLTTLYVNHSLSKRTLGYFWASQDKPETGPKRTQLAVALRHNF